MIKFYKALAEIILIFNIYQWIQEQFLYYKNQINLGWKNSIRHNLSLNKCFMKVARSRHDPGKGCYWAINHRYNHDKTPFEKRKKPLLLPSEIFKKQIGELQRSFLQTIQTRQVQQMMVTDQATHNILFPVGHVQQIPQLEDKAMQLNDWLTTSEPDLSPSLSRYLPSETLCKDVNLLNSSGQLQRDSVSSGSKDAALIDTVTCDAAMRTLTCDPVQSWTSVKTEHSPTTLFNDCVDPMEVENINSLSYDAAMRTPTCDQNINTVKQSQSPPCISDMLLSSECPVSSCKLPRWSDVWPDDAALRTHVWPDVGSWLGSGLELFDGGDKLREVPDSGDDL